MADASTGSFAVGQLKVFYDQEGPRTSVTLEHAVSGRRVSGTAEDLAGVVAGLVERKLVTVPLTPDQKREGLGKKLRELGLDATVYDSVEYETHDWYMPNLLAVVVLGTFTIPQTQALIEACREFFKDDEVAIR